MNAPTTVLPRLKTIAPNISYSIVGAILGMGAPLGFLVLHRLGTRRRPRKSLANEFRSNAGAYGYIGLVTPLVIGTLGHLIGVREERVRRASEQNRRLREEFAAVVAHDLRNPIQAIVLQAQQILRHTKDDQVATDVQAIHRVLSACERLGRMVDDLLDASVIETERLAIHPTVIRLPDAISTLVNRILPTLGHHPIELELHGEPSAIEADPTRFEQILTNLLENAAKYSAEGSPIVVHVTPEAEGAVVAVEDRGPGIASEDIPRLFDRFYQARRAREKKSGLGLGLYITKGLVTAHGGKIDLTTELGKGSTFSVWMPKSSMAGQQRRLEPGASASVESTAPNA